MSIGGLPRWHGTLKHGVGIATACRAARQSATSRFLLHYPLSFSSQIVRLAAAELNVGLTLIEIDIGPSHENFSPWYLALTRKAVVPALIDNGRIVTDCLRISRYLEQVPGSLSLTPADIGERQLAESWVRRQQAIPERELGYSLAAGIAGRMARLELRYRRRLLRQLRKDNPSLVTLYDAKLRDLKEWRQCVSDAAARQALVDDVDGTLNVLESQLDDDRPFIAGCQYSLADVAWTVFLARAKLLGMDHWFWPAERPKLAAYYERMTRRPAFAKADIHTRLPRSFLIRSLLRAHGKKLLIALLALGTVVLWG